MSSNEYTPGFGFGNPTISVFPPSTAVSKVTTFTSLNNVPEVTQFSTAPVVTQTFQDPPVVATDSHLPLDAKGLISHAAPPVPTVTKDSTLQAAPATATLISNSAFTRYLSVPGFMSSYEYTPEFGLGYPTVPLAPPATAVSKLTTFASLNIPPEAAKSTTVPVVTQTYQNPQVVAAAPALPTVTKDSILQVAPPLPAFHLRLQFLNYQLSPVTTPLRKSQNSLRLQLGPKLTRCLQCLLQFHLCLR
ncbi:mucin-2-like [Ixodes scapularis]